MSLDWLDKEDMTPEQRQFALKIFADEASDEDLRHQVKRYWQVVDAPPSRRVAEAGKPAFTMKPST